MSEEIVVIPGDGIGKEVVPATVRVLKRLPVQLSFLEAEAGDAVAEATGEPLPEATRDAVSSANATLFGAAGETAADVILPLRSLVDAFANVRPVRAYPGTDALDPSIDFVIIRENTEGVYSGIEDEIAPGVTTLTRVITKRASRRIGKFTAEYANSHDSDLVTIAHKANVMRVTDGLFKRVLKDTLEDGDWMTETMLMDALATDLVLNPTEYDVIVTPNLAGDVLSDLGAGLVGGLGLLPSGNIGPDRGVFEPVHGSAPDIAGEGIANPAATMFSAAMMLESLGYEEVATTLREAVETVLAEGPHTPDLGGSATTEAVTDAVIDAIE